MKVIRDESGTSSLILNEAQDEDAGEIKCVATNDIGSATTAAFLNVEGLFLSQFIIFNPYYPNMVLTIY